MRKIEFWKKVSNYSFYACAVILVLDTFFFKDNDPYSTVSFIEIIALMGLMVSGLIIIISRVFKDDK